MVWNKIIKCLKKIRYILILILSILLLSKKVLADSVYDEGNLSNTYVTYFADVINSLNPNIDYVIYRSGQYEYSLVTGNLEFNNKTFTSDESVTIYKITTNSGYNSSYQYSISEVTNFNLSCDNALVYSNLGQYPNIQERGSYYEEVIIILLSVIMLFNIIWKIFRY